MLQRVESPRDACRLCPAVASLLPSPLPDAPLLCRRCALPTPRLLAPPTLDPLLALPPPDVRGLTLLTPPTLP
jgi:hypothetical protein